MVVREFKTQERVDSAIESREIARSDLGGSSHEAEMLVRLKTELEELQKLSQVRIRAKSER